MKQLSTSIYGVRIYHDGAVLMPHCDRLPLISSAIVNVAQDVDEDWPLEVYGRDGQAHNVTMKPGDIVLYESASLIHGRPLPLKGKYYANIFIHFAPTGFLNGAPFVNQQDPELPPYLTPGSPWATRQKADGGDKVKFDVGLAAAHGDMKRLQMTASFQPKKLLEGDYQNWQPIHRAVRSGQTDAVQFLLDHGADPNAATNSHGQPLDLAMKHHTAEHPVTKLLLRVGAIRQPTHHLTAHQAAKRNDIEALKTYLRNNPGALHEKDKNDWQPLHEAVRVGHTDAVDLLVNQANADVQAKTFNGQGKSPLLMAQDTHGLDHPVTRLLAKAVKQMHRLASAVVHDEA